MDRSSAHAYVYARASGMLAKSFIGKRAEHLFEAQNLSALWTLLFDVEVPSVPETLLAYQLEKRAEETFLLDYSSLLDAYSAPDLLLVNLLRYYDYTNLKLIISSLRNDSSQKPDLIPTGKFSFLRYAALPDLQKITRNTPVSWLQEIPEIENEKVVEQRLDLEYIRQLWASLKKISQSEREPIQKLLRKELMWYNIVWAIRLRLYYDMKPQDVLLQLATVSDESIFHDPLAGAAAHIVNFSTNTYTDWEKWEFASYLNPHEEGNLWVIDPSWIENTVKTEITKLALSQFHQHSSSSAFLVAWFKIKQQELNYIRSATEGLRLNIPQEQMKNLL